MKMINAFTLLLSGAPIVQSSASTTFQNEKPKKEDEFDDYEEL
jgi:hypothetical protein